MGSLSLFDIVWHVLLAGAVALTPGMVVWSLALGLVTAVRRLANRRGPTCEAKRGTVLP